MKLLLDAGHGLGNRASGIFDPGAEGNGTTEHAEVEKLRGDVTAKLAGRVTVVAVPNQKKSLKDKGNFIAANFAQGDIFISLHMNASKPTGTGVEVLFDDRKPENQETAATISSKYAAATGLKNRGAKPDTTSHEGNVFLLGRCPGQGFLIETGFITSVSDLAIVRAKAADAIANIVADLFGAA